MKPFQCLVCHRDFMYFEPVLKERLVFPWLPKSIFIRFSVTSLNKQQFDKLKSYRSI